MLLNYGDIEKDFDYLTNDEFVNDISGNKMSGGVNMPKVIYSRLTKLTEKYNRDSKEEVKETHIILEVLKHFSLKRFQNTDTVSRTVYQATVDENIMLTDQVEKLVAIITTLKGQSNQPEINHNTERWPTTNPNPNANYFANQNAPNPALNHANSSALNYANDSASNNANSSASNNANNATDRVLQQVSLLFVGYVKKAFGKDINPEHLYAWIRQYVK